MLLYATTTSERASKGQGGNEYITVDLSVGRVPIGQLELYYNNDTVKDEQINMDEWVLQFRQQDEDGEWKDWDIIAQGNVIPENKSKGKKKKDECTAQQWSKTCKGCKHCKRTLEQD